MSKILDSAVELNKIQYIAGNNKINFTVDVYSNGAPIADATAGSYANAAFLQANAAFESANNVAPQIQPAFDRANNAYIQANAAFDRANAGGGGLFPANNNWGYLETESLTAFGERNYNYFAEYDLRQYPKTGVTIMDMGYIN
jgi:hypothetical protein